MKSFAFLCACKEARKGSRLKSRASEINKLGHSANKKGKGEKAPSAAFRRHAGRRPSSSRATAAVRRGWATVRLCSRRHCSRWRRCQTRSRRPRAALCARRSFVLHALDLHALGVSMARAVLHITDSVSERLSSMRLEAPANVSLPAAPLSALDCLLARLRVLRCSARSEGQHVDHHRAKYCACGEVVRCSLRWGTW